MDLLLYFMESLQFLSFTWVKLNYYFGGGGGNKMAEISRLKKTKEKGKKREFNVWLS